MKDRVKRPITPDEIIVTYISLGWAVVLLTNNTIFEQSSNFRQIASIAQYEWVLGLVCLALASVKVVGIALRHLRTRWAGLMLSAIFWVLMSASFAFAGEFIEFNTGFVVYSGVAILSLLASKEVMRVDRTD